MNSTYILAQLSIRDRARYDRYAASFMQTLRPFDARLLAASEAVDVLEGEWRYGKVVLLEFKDCDEARRWLSSAAYRQIAVDREASAQAIVLSFEGVRPW